MKKNLKNILIFISIFSYISINISYAEDKSSDFSNSILNNLSPGDTVSDPSNPLNLTDQDKESLKELRDLLHKQPQFVQEEVTLYRDHIAKLKKDKEDFHSNLSEKTKDFLTEEEKMKKKLSNEARREFYKKKLFK